MDEIVRRIESGDKDAIPLLLGATEQRRQNELQSEARLVALRGDVSRLRLALDRMLEREGVDPNMPGIPGPGNPANRSTATPRVPRSPDEWAPGSLAPTTGLAPGQTGVLKTVLPPLQQVDASSQRRGDEPVALEEADFSADAVRQGKLLFRAGRHAEAIQLLTRNGEPEAKYWLAQTYRAVGRVAEALELLRAIAENAEAGPYARYAATDIEFIDFEQKLATRKGTPGATNK
jgi:hypothetical protein